MSELGNKKIMANNIRRYMEMKGISRKEFCQRLGFKYSTVTDWLNAEKYPRIDKIELMANFFNISKADLVEPSNAFAGHVDGQFMTFANEVPVPGNNIKVPIIASVKCGYNGLAYEYDQGYVYIDKSHGDVRAFRCYGDSMTGIGIYDGDVAIVRIQDEVESGQLAIVTVDNEEGCLKRVRLQEGAIILESANPDFPPRVFTGENMNRVHIVGRVLELRRTF